MKSTTRNVVLVLILLSLAYLWRAEGIKRAVADAKLLERGQTLDSIAQVTDTLFADSLKHLHNKIVVAEGAARLARHEVWRLKGMIDSLPPPPPSDTGTALRDSVIAFQDSVITDQEKEILFWKATADAKDSLNLRLREERDRYRDLSQVWQHRAQPGFVSRVFRGLPYFLVGAVAWEAVR